MHGIRKALIRTLYDMQHERIQTGNRICAEIKVRLGQRPGRPEDELDKEAKQYLARARTEFHRLTDAFVLTSAHKYLKVDFADCEIITDAGMLVFVELYEEQLAHEEKMLKVIAKIVQQHPLWPAFLEHVKGCGPLMSAVILAEFDIHKAERVSQFWKYAGLDVAGDGRGRSKRKEHLVEQSYTDANGDEKIKLGVTYNPFLKTKMVGVLGSSFLRQNPEACKYRRLYDECKHRLENHAVYGIAHDAERKAAAKRDGRKYAPVLHRHRMALRWAVKMFLQDLWLAWRLIEELPITAPYHEAVLGHRHHKKTG